MTSATAFVSTQTHVPVDRRSAVLRWKGARATLVRVGDVTLSPLVFDLEHEQARRIQLVQTSEKDFEVRIEAANEVAAASVFQEVIQSVKRVFR